MRIAAFLITSLINLIAGVVLLFFLLLALNGFTGKQAEIGLILYIIWVLIASILAGVLSVRLANYLAAKKSFSRWIAALISIAVFSLTGIGSIFAALIAAVFFVSVMR